MSTTENVLAVVNPISGGIEKADLISLVKEQVKLRQGSLNVYYTTGKNDKEEIKELITSSPPDRILSIGGDGTIKLIAEILETRDIPIGIFPAGSANGLAENLNIPDDYTEMISIALGNKFKILDCISINGELCLHISDMGLNAELIRNYEEGNIRGKLGYLIQSIPTLIKSEFPFDFTIHMEDQVVQRKAFLVGVANARRYGTGATINPKGNYDDGAFEILVFKKFNIPEILKTFRENNELSQDFLEIFTASQAKIDCKRKVPFQIDGEFRGEVNSIIAEISPFKIRVPTP